MRNLRHRRSKSPLDLEQGNWVVTENLRRRRSLIATIRAWLGWLPRSGAVWPMSSPGVVQCRSLQHRSSPGEHRT